MLKIYHFLVKYKFLHILFWLVKTANLYHDLTVSWNTIPKTVIYFSVVNEIGFEILCVYTTIYYLIPKYFYPRKFIKYNFLALSLYILSAFSIELFSDLFAKFYYSETLSPKFNWIIVVGNFLDILTYCVVFSILVMVDYYYKRDKLNKQKETDRLNSELNFLKAQLNPHFLLNAINNIYVLMGEDKNKSRDYLLQFSQLLRYQLYECSKEKLTIKEELDFIKNYINFEKIRLNDNINLDINISDSFLQNYSIAPLLLIPFVENCFKHVSHSEDGENSIFIKINLQDSTLFFESKNTFEKNSSTSNGGVGLKNVKRRLELLYPNNYKHEVKIIDNYYINFLQIELLDEN